MKYMDMLAAIGIGNAHPGGFAATLRQLERYPIPAGSHVLEVGCGTGRTSCYLAKLGHRVTAIDIREDMILKAKKRAEHEKVHVHFLVGDASKLPFPQDTFDVLIVESVSVFADTFAAVTEYNRVLKRGGTLYDREVVRLKEMPGEVWNKISDFYGVSNLLDTKQWAELLSSVKFGRIAIDGPYPFPKQMNDDVLKYPDSFQQIDSGQLFNPEIWKLTAEYEDIMQRYHAYIGYALMIGVK